MLFDNMFPPYLALFPFPPGLARLASFRENYLVSRRTPHRAQQGGYVLSVSRSSRLVPFFSPPLVYPPWIRTPVLFRHLRLNGVTSIAFPRLADSFRVPPPNDFFLTTALHFQKALFPSKASVTRPPPIHHVALETLARHHTMTSPCSLPPPRR